MNARDTDSKGDVRKFSKWPSGTQKAKTQQTTHRQAIAEHVRICAEALPDFRELMNIQPKQMPAKRAKALPKILESAVPMVSGSEMSTAPATARRMAQRKQ